MPLSRKSSESPPCRKQPSDERKCRRPQWRNAWFCICLPFALMSLTLFRYNPLPLEDEASKPQVVPLQIPTAQHDKDDTTEVATAASNIISDDDPDELTWESDLSPKIVWLASYPNSGTSFTMTLVERASNKSTATNYGAEVTDTRHDSLPIYPNHPEGPFWEGTSKNAERMNRNVRGLPHPFVMTKTHCGGRCVKCPASEYLVNSTRKFLYACQKTSYRKKKEMVFLEEGYPKSVVKGLIHLIRNPYHNVVARFHLERKNMVARNSSYEELFPYNSKGFHRWCHFLDSTYAYDDKKFLPNLREHYKHPDIPCHAEFFKWTQWHNHLVQGAPMLGRPEDRTQEYDDGTGTMKRSVPIHVVWYEDYADHFNTTFEGIMDFLQLPVATEQIRSFRSLPTYEDHFTEAQVQAIQSLIQYVATPQTWELIKHYFV